jgi:hypothetical protein
MSEIFEYHYIPGETIKGNKPLDRYLPPVRLGVVSKWLGSNVKKGSWLLDPFGATPEIAAEAARNGYNVLVTANNPIIRFILEMQCQPPSRADFQSAIAMLASTQVGGERLEPHIKSLYETRCDECNQIIQAEAFLWERGSKSPYARIYNCPNCNDSGERPTTEEDIENTERFISNTLPRARALERVTPLHDPDRHHVEDALEVYLPRAIYALVTILNKLSSIPRENKDRRLLSALMLIVFDRANTLWLYPKERQRPKQLIVPQKFREHNIWDALESGVDFWTSTQPAIPISIWPELPQSESGICIFEGRIKDLPETVNVIDISAVVTSFPRPNQAFWTLSALWSGWLWGHEALENFKSVLRHRRYDWGWHTNAIHAALNRLATNLSDKTPFFGLINEVEPGFLSSIIIGSLVSNLDLCGLALRAEDGQAQIIWHCIHEEKGAETEFSSVEDVIANSARNYIEEQRGEPSPYIYLHAAGLLGLTGNSSLKGSLSPSEYLSKVQSRFQNALTYRNGFIRFEGSDKSIEIGRWWLKDYNRRIPPLADRIEVAVVNILLKNRSSTFSEIDDTLCQMMPGIAPPDILIIRECLHSYGEEIFPESDQWAIQKGDHPGKRRGDIEELKNILLELGDRLGFTVNADDNSTPTVYWVGDKGENDYSFFLSASAILGKYLVGYPPPRNKSFIVIPGSRSNIIVYKLEHNMYLKQIVDQGWQFIKFRHVRLLAERSILSKDNLDEQLALDPPTYSTPQIRLL